MILEQEHKGIGDEDFAYSQEVIAKLAGYYDGKVVGQRNLRRALIAAIIADGHILIEMASFPEFNVHRTCCRVISSGRRFTIRNPASLKRFSVRYLPILSCSMK